MHAGHDTLLLYGNTGLATAAGLATACAYCMLLAGKLPGIGATANATALHVAHSPATRAGLAMHALHGVLLCLRVGMLHAIAH